MNNDKKAARKRDDSNLDQVLSNIREILVNSTKKLQTISPDLIDQIYRFENLNDFTRIEDIEELARESGIEFNTGQKRKFGRNRRNKSQRPSVYSQFGHDSNGLANVIIQQSAAVQKTNLKNELEMNLRAMIKNYLSYDTKEMMAQTKNSFNKQNNPGSNNAGVLTKEQ